jgi:hypothetical protein
MSRILADKVTNYNNDGPFEAEKGINIPLARPLQVSGNSGVSGQYLVSTGIGLTWETFPELFSGDYNDLTNKPTLFSGSYNNLTDKPAILDINLGVPVNNQYLKFNGTQWVNSNLPPIYEYDLLTSYNANNGVVGIILQDQFFEQKAISLLGDNGITLSTTVNGDILITSPTVSEYDSDTTKDDISDMFLDGTNTGISYTYNPITKTIDSSVSLAEQLVYTLYGSSSAANTAKIYLDNGTVESGFVNIVGTNGIDISWNIGTSTISFSKTDPDPYVLPAATSTTLGGVIPDSSDFNIDGLGNLTVNFPASGINLADLSIATEGVPSGNGNLSYDNTTGQFTYTPPSFSLDDLNDVSIVGSVVNQVLQFNGTNWQNTSIAIPAGLDDLNDVSLSGATSGDILQYNGISWSNTSLDISTSPIEELSNVNSRTNDDPGQILLWGGTSWDPVVGKLENFDVSAQPINGQTLQWNGSTNLWDPVTLAGGGGATSLDGLTDVSVSGATSGDFLYYNGTNWTNTTIPAVPQYLSELLDVSDAAASNGYVLTWNSTASEWQPAVSGASPGAGLTSRTTTFATTSLIADGDYDTPNINGFKSYMLMKIQTSAAAWVTLYCDDDTRTADLTRLETTDPTPGSGVIAEVITTGAETILMTPGVMGFNNDVTPGANIYAKVVNKSGTTQAITVTLTLLQLEA